MMRKKAAIFMAMIMSLSLLSACSGGSGSGSGSEDTGSGSGGEEETVSVRLGIMTTAHALPLHYAEMNGYFEDLGLEVTVDYFSNGPAMNEAIASGDIDMADMGQMPSITGAITNGSKIVAWIDDDEASIQGYARNDSDIVKAGKGHVEDYPEIYGEAENWKGKEVICAKGTSSHYGLLATLADLGLSESDITLTNMEGTAGAAAFASGTGDIFFGFDPQWAEFYTNSDEYTQISSCINAGKGLYNTLVASADYYENHPDGIVKVIQGMLQAEQVFQADEQTFYDAMYEWQNTYGTCSEELAEYSAKIRGVCPPEDQKEKFEETNGTSEVSESYEEVSTFMVENGVISEEDKAVFDESDAVDPTYLYEAIDNLQK